MLIPQARLGEEATALCCQPLKHTHSGIVATLPAFACKRQQNEVAGSSAKPAAGLGPPSDPQNPATQCESFTLTSVLLGGGRQGNVWLAKDASGHTCAVKCMEDLSAVPYLVKELVETQRHPTPPLESRRSSLQCESSKQAAVEAEAQLWSRLRHPAIVRLDGFECTMTDYGMPEYRFYMEHMNGGSLWSFAKRYYPGGRMPESHLRWFLRSILQALRHMHAEHVVHLDLKAENVLLTWGDEQLKGGHALPLPSAKLSDFGCARSLVQCKNDANRAEGLSAPQKSADGVAPIGTPGFIAPEVIAIRCDSSEACGTAADIWSFGCTVLQLLNGAPPVTPGVNYLSFLYAIATDPEHMHKFIPEAKETEEFTDNCALIELISDEEDTVTISPELRDLLMQCLEPSPAKRPTAAELLQHPFFHEDTHTVDAVACAMLHEACGFNNTISTWSTANEGLSEVDEDNEDDEEVHR